MTYFCGCFNRYPRRLSSLIDASLEYLYLFLCERRNNIQASVFADQIPLTAGAEMIQQGMVIFLTIMEILSIPLCTMLERIKSHMRYLLANGMDAMRRSEASSGTIAS